MKPSKKKSLHIIGAKPLVFITISLFLLIEYYYTLNYFDLHRLKIDLTPLSFSLVKILLFSSYLIMLYFALVRKTDILPEILLLSISPLSLDSFYTLNLDAWILFGFLLILYSKTISRKIKIITICLLLLFSLFLWKLGLLILNVNLFLTLTILGILVLAAFLAPNVKTLLLLVLIPAQLTVTLLELYAFIFPGSKVSTLDKELMIYRNLIYGTSYVYCGDGNVKLVFNKFCTDNLSIARYAIVSRDQSFKNPWFKPVLKGKYYILYEKILLNVSYRICNLRI
jgi:hypothetical protein